MFEYDRGRLQVPFRNDLKPLLQFIANREGRSATNAASQIIEAVITEIGLRMADQDPELGVEFEKAGVRLDDGPKLSSVLSEALQ